LTDYLQLLSDVSEDLAQAILSEWTAEECRASESVVRLRAVARVLADAGREIPFCMANVLRNAAILN
jgi:hypothetical protein